MKIGHSDNIKFQKLLTINVLWQVVALVITTYDHFVIRSNFVIETDSTYSFLNHLAINLSAALFAGVFGGAFLVYYVNVKLRDQKYGKNILAVVVSFIVVVSTITVILGFTYIPYITNVSLFSPEWKVEFGKFMQDSLHLKNVIVWSLIVGLTQLFLQINDKFGHGVLWQFIMGKYHSPIQEERVFMFLDIRSSTSIAENLGHENYYLLLRDFYSDITNSIVTNKGSVYQYIGDEVVISWKLKDGIQNNHCINCFVDIMKVINDKRENYLEKYDLVPAFKAGLHYGAVTAGEIGVLKRDITYSGDVLNTASRIQEQCNKFNVDILLAKDLVDILPATTAYVYKLMGQIQLRGKEKIQSLYTLSIKN